MKVEGGGAGRSARKVFALIAVLLVLAIVALAYLLGSKGQLLPPSSTISSPGFTVVDETTSLGEQTWEVELYFPSLHTGSVIDAVTRSSCPEHVQRVTASNSTTVTIATQNMVITSTPSRGFERITIGDGYKVNNCMPGVQPGDVFIHWNNASVFRFSGLATPFASSDVKAYVSYGEGDLLRNGAFYHGYGTYAHYTSTTMSDPRPGYYFQLGWTATPSYVLFVAKTSTQDFSAVSIGTNTLILTPVDISTGPGCSSFTYTFSLSGSQVTIKDSPLRFLVGTSQSCAGETIGPFSDSLGQAGVMWALVDR